MAKFDVDSIQEWQSFEHDGVEYDLGHLSSHLLVFKADRQDYEFVVIYGLHCFTKDVSCTNIPYLYEDGRHGQMVCLERYEASKYLV
uniref:Glycogen phosphorylase n=1 Tax=Pseudomonas syringae pv. actinidiae TaxID=103796 RepID=A0A7L7TBZ4_PSESF|nr:Glycogen phosphorylase [Pseudomonas syringae pv. actinidiae]